MRTRINRHRQTRRARALLLALMSLAVVWAVLPESLSHLIEPTASAATFTVTNTNDSGAGSLRQAIIDANNNPGPDNISFNIPGAGVHTITPLSQLPALLGSVTVDGYTQPGSSPNTLAQGNNAVILIELNGTSAGDDSDGMNPAGSNNTIRGLVINRFDGIGIAASSSNNNKIEGCFLGTDPTGTIAQPNSLAIFYTGNATNNTIGGLTPAQRNLISGNGQGIQFQSAAGGQIIVNNYIGTDRHGTTALPNVQIGIFLISDNNVIGDGTAAGRNVISANTGSGIRIDSQGSGNKIQGNHIGADVTGTVDMGNSGVGILIEGANTLVGGTDAGKRNIISGNNLHGIYINNTIATGNLVQGNFIGLDINGAALGNGGSGVQLDASQNTIGGTSPSMRNHIAHNTSYGVHVRGAIGVNGNNRNPILGNYIHSNGRLGINLGSPEAVNQNDAGDDDIGPNDLQNFPQIQYAVTDGVNITIKGALNSAANKQYRVEFFHSTSCDPTGYGEGAQFIAATDVQTVGNDAAINATFAVAVGTGQFITATATDPDGNTSEFSQCVQAVPVNSGFLNFSSTTYTVNEAAGVVTITVTRTGGSFGQATVNYATSNGTATAADYTPASGQLVFANGETSKTFDVAINNDTIDEPDETINLLLSNASGAAMGDTSAAVITISDDDPLPQVSISDVTNAEGNSGKTAFNFTVSLTNPSSQTVSVLYSTADGTAQGASDFDTVASTLIFTPGETSKTITVQVNGDTTDEPNETFLVNLDGVVNNVATISDGQGTGTITNDDAPIKDIEFEQASYNVAEDAGSLFVKIKRTGDTTGAASIFFTTADNSALQKSDFNIALGTLKFAAGETEKTVQIFITNDAYVESPESFSIMLSNPSGGNVGATALAVVTISDDDAVPTATNPIDGSAFFIRQHYVDFLNRDPEPSGLQGWLQILNNCAPGNTQCDRIEVSSGFFRSPEFYDRGYFVYRFYETALGRKPDYLEFMADLRRVSGFLTTQELEAAKQEFALEFTQRQEFRNKYDQYPSVTHAQEYVDALLQTAGVNVANRQQLASNLLNSQMQRWDVLRNIVESQEVGQKFFNKAFVVMQYFGYLRRDPDALYLDWINTLNQTGNYRTLVNGFVNSPEYRQRFNQQ